MLKAVAESPCSECSSGISSAPLIMNIIIHEKENINPRFSLCSTLSCLVTSAQKSLTNRGVMRHMEVPVYSISLRCLSLRYSESSLPQWNHSQQLNLSDQIKKGYSYHPQCCPYFMLKICPPFLSCLVGMHACFLFGGGWGALCTEAIVSCSVSSLRIATNLQNLYLHSLANLLHKNF